jgi:hypothetical protein
MLKRIQVKLGAASRRQVLLATGSSLAAGAVASAAPAVSEKYPGDLTILNVALGLEHQAIAAYDAGANTLLDHSRGIEGREHCHCRELVLCRRQGTYEISVFERDRKPHGRRRVATPIRGGPDA